MLQRINDVTYKIQRTARAKPQIVHRNRLKSYKGDVQLEWWERAAHGAPAEEEPARGERQGARGSDPRASPPGPPPSVGEGTGREPVEEAEPERPEQSGGMLGGEDSVVDGGGVPAEPALSEPAEGGGKRMTRTVPYGAGWLPPLVFLRPAIFPPRACAVDKTRPHGCRTFERVSFYLG